MKRTYDSQRAKAYRADDLFRAWWVRQPESRAPFTENSARVLVSLMERDTWPRGFLGNSVVAVRFHAGRRSSGTFEEVALARRGLWPGVVCHEMAHVMTVRAASQAWVTVVPHGEEWAGVYVGLVWRYMGPTAARVLQECYVKERVEMSVMPFGRMVMVIRNDETFGWSK